MPQIARIAFLVLFAGAYAQNLKGTASTPDASSATTVELKEVVHYPPHFVPPTSFQATLCFVAVFGVPILGLIGMTWAKEKGGSVPGCCVCLLVTLIWAVIAVQATIFFEGNYPGKLHPAAPPTEAATSAAELKSHSSASPLSLPPAALLALCASFVAPAIAIAAMMYAKEKSGSMPGLCICSVITIIWVVLAAITW
eukprot:TRINITY_DN110566_c0_g1_i1.p1 TRINITY_DN110566_c0_g1~~TRINITY_DN110566_c0_g1_i1.p1  ORF type:complete len:197 (+),score=41.40 TRINITY_DN110566_c0_g1_i1:62-652(+)